MGDRPKKFIRGHNALKKSGPKQISKAKEIEKKKVSVICHFSLTVIESIFE